MPPLGAGIGRIKPRPLLGKPAIMPLPPRLKNIMP